MINVFSICPLCLEQTCLEIYPFEPEYEWATWDENAQQYTYMSECDACSFQAKPNHVASKITLANALADDYDYGNNPLPQLRENLMLNIAYFIYDRQQFEILIGRQGVREDLPSDDMVVLVDHKSDDNEDSLPDYKTVYIVDYQTKIWCGSDGEWGYVTMPPRKDLLDQEIREHTDVINRCSDAISNTRNT